MTVALCMIVRDEAAILERCLASVAGLIDTWVICDTGSTDATPQVIERALAGIPGELHHTPWVDFGHNRSELMRRARGAADHLLLLDADMEVLQRGPIPPLSADAYLLRETGALDFGVPRLVRGDRHWWFEGSTHEYLACDGQYVQEELDALVIDHHADGAARRTKLIRDVGLLKRDIAEHPGRARPVFYLAQTYRDLGEPDLAIDWYRRRVELGGWEEETFYANLQEGALKAERDVAWGTPVLLEAWGRRPSRAEPLHELARAHRVAGNLAAAHLFAERGLEIAYPSDILFVHRWVYTWGLRYERGLAAAGLGELEQAREDLLAVLDAADVPADVAAFTEEALEELGAGVRTERRALPGGRVAAPRLTALVPETRTGEIHVEVRPAWPSFNPSVAADGDGFALILRTANYRIQQGVLHRDGTLRNVNYLLGLDGGLAVTSIAPIEDRADGPPRFPSQIQGYEDCRLIRVGDDWFASATVCDLDPDERRRMALLRLDDAAITEVLPLDGPDPERHEKNWMPFVAGGTLHFVYACGPTVVLRCDTVTGAVEEVARAEAPEGAAALRGGSQGVEVEDGWLFVVHEVDRAERKPRYLHRFVRLDRAFRLAAVSAPFTFTSDRVEFCAGMARRGDDLVLSFGISDAAAGLALVPLDGVQSMLQATGAGRPMGEVASRPALR